MDLSGIDGESFGKGWAVAAAFFMALGGWLWRILAKAKDEQIAMLAKRIEHMERSLDDERDQCRRRLEQHADRIRVLEAMTLGGIRQATQAALSEQRVTRRDADGEG